MKRQKSSGSAAIALGSAKALTKGAWGNYHDEVLMQSKAGLSKD